MQDGKAIMTQPQTTFTTTCNRDYRIPGVPGVSHTKHSRKRTSQRGISRHMIQDTIDFGTCVWKQGMEFYTMLRKDIQDRFDPAYADKLEGVVVVLGKDGHIRTAYKNKHGHRRITKKSKRLYHAT